MVAPPRQSQTKSGHPSLGGWTNALAEEPGGGLFRQRQQDRSGGPAPLVRGVGRRFAARPLAVRRPIAHSQSNGKQVDANHLGRRTEQLERKFLHQRGRQIAGGPGSRQSAGRRSRPSDEELLAGARVLHSNIPTSSRWSRIGGHIVRNSKQTGCPMV